MTRILIALLCCAAPLAAQTSTLASRAALQEDLARLERDPAKSGAAALIRARLESGDFQAGDQIILSVQGEQELSDTFTVGEAVDLTLPQVGTLSLRGVLRSELRDHVTAYLSRYLRAPAVEVRPLMRVLVEGQVAKPGFYGIAPEQPLADVFSAAGGLTQTAKVNATRVERGQATIWGGPTLQEALGHGYSVDRLSLRAGDRVYVPARADSERSLRLLGVVLGLPLAILALTKAF